MGFYSLRVKFDKCAQGTPTDKSNNKRSKVIFLGPRKQLGYFILQISKKLKRTEKINKKVPIFYWCFVLERFFVDGVRVKSGAAFAKRVVIIYLFNKLFKMIKIWHHSPWRVVKINVFLSVISGGEESSCFPFGKETRLLFLSVSGVRSLGRKLLGESSLIVY